MRLHFRLRTILLALVLLSFPLAYGTIAARQWFSAFQKHHAIEAYNNWAMADDLLMRTRSLQQHGTPADAKQIGELRRRAHEHLRKSHWHEFLSGRPVLRVAT